MGRTGPSIAEQRLIDALAARELQASPAQLERWRTAGLLERFPRRSLGRGRGFASECTDAHVEAAAALARFARRGRDLRLAVIDWFRAAAGQPDPSGHPAPPDPPLPKVREAVLQVIRSSSFERMASLARAASGEAEQDAFFEETSLTARAMRWPVWNVEAMRQALMSGTDLPRTAFREETMDAATAQLLAATGFGAGELDADALADMVAVTGFFPQIPVEVLRQHLREAELEGRPLLPPSASEGPSETLIGATDDALRRSRTVALGLQGFGTVLLMHGLLMPDTHGFRAVRASIHALGVGNLLSTMSAGSHKTTVFAHNLVSCLSPYLDSVHEALSNQVRHGPPLLHGPDDRATGEAFLDEWLTALRCAAGQAGPGEAQARDADPPGVYGDGLDA